MIPIDVLLKFNEECHLLNDVNSLLPYYKAINYLLFNKRFDCVDEFLKSSDPKNYSDVLLVGIPRLTCQYKKQIKSWKMILEQCKNELIKRGYNPQKSLMGLID